MLTVTGADMKKLSFNDKKLYEEYMAEQRAVNEKWAKRLSRKYYKGQTFRNQHATVRITRDYENDTHLVKHTWLRGAVTPFTEWVLPETEITKFLNDLNFKEVK